MLDRAIPPWRFEQVPDLEVGRAHLDAQGLGLVRAGHGTAIVVGQHHHRDPLQGGVEDPLAGDVEVVAVHQGVLGTGAEGHAQRSLRTTPFTTPQMVSS